VAAHIVGDKINPMASKRYLVTGHVFVPNKAKIEIEADSAEAALKLANKRLKKGGIRQYIVPGSEDEGAAFGFDALDAEEILGEERPVGRVSETNGYRRPVPM
jgi:hypothetical protein